MMRIQRVPLAVEIPAAVTIHRNQRVPDAVAADAAPRRAPAATIRRQHPHRRNHVDRIRDSEKIVK